MTSLYLISPTNIDVDKFPLSLANILNNSSDVIGAFQLRLKGYDIREVYKISKILLPICEEYQIPFFINDYYQIADDLPINGIHIGQNDGNLNVITQNYHHRVKIGISCMNSIELALKASSYNVDYVSFGAFYPTKTKQNTKIAHFDILESWQKKSKTPYAVIGGINQNNIQEIIAYRPDYICLISAIWSASEPQIIVKNLKEILQRNINR